MYGNSVGWEDLPPDCQLRILRGALGAALWRAQAISSTWRSMLASEPRRVRFVATAVGSDGGRLLSSWVRAHARPNWHAVCNHNTATGRAALLAMCSMIQDNENAPGCIELDGVNGGADWWLTPLVGALRAGSDCAVRSLEIVGCALSPEAGQKLAGAAPRLSSLVLPYNDLGISTTALAQAVTTPVASNLRTLDLRGNGVSDAEMKAIAAAAVGPDGLQRLFLSENEISDVGVMTFGNVVAGNDSMRCALQWLDLGLNHFGPAVGGGLAAVCEILAQPQNNMRELCLRDSHANPEWEEQAVWGVAGAKLLANALQSQNCFLSCLIISGNQIGDSGAAVVARALSNQHRCRSRLKVLDLSHNEITAHGTQALADTIAVGNCTTLILAGNSIGVAGGYALASAISSDKCELTVLKIGNQLAGFSGTHHSAEDTADIEVRTTCGRIGDEGIFALARALLQHKRQNGEMAELCLEGNGISEVGVEAIAHALAPLSAGSRQRRTTDLITDSAQLPALRHLSLTTNPIGSVGIRALANAISRGARLQRLVLGANELDTRGVKALHSAIQARHASARPSGSWKFEVEVDGQRFRSAGMGVAAEGLVAMQAALTSVLDAGSTNQQQSQLWTEATEADLDSDSDQESSNTDTSDY